MSLAETIFQHSLKLPEPAAREVLDFIEFLERRYAINTENEPIDARLLSLTPEQREAYAYLSKIRIDWGGKPITDRKEANARL
jgi:hypothetical protein